MGIARASGPRHRLVGVSNTFELGGLRGAKLIVCAPEAATDYPAALWTLEGLIVQACWGPLRNRSSPRMDDARRDFANSKRSFEAISPSTRLVPQIFFHVMPSGVCRLA